MSQDINFMIPGGGGGGAPSGAAGGDLGGAYPNPTVGGAHFGGIDGQYMIRRSGLWAPATPNYADLAGTPVVGALTNGAQSLTLNADGTLAAVASAATLGALQTNVASQFISGNNTRGYVRVTISATPVAALTAFCIVQFSAALSSRAYIVVSPIVTSNAQYGDSAAALNFMPGSLSSWVTQAAQTAPSSFPVVCTAALAANVSYAFIYQVLE